jgi:cytochrome c-type biogenesis protein CcmH
MRYRILASAALLLALAAPLAAQETPPGLTPEQTRTANEAMAQLRSPVTPFHTVDMCPSVPALRDSIRVAAAAGFTTEQIVEDVIARHGEQIRILPERRGAGLWAWIATPLVLLIGGGLIFARLRSDQRNAPPAAVSAISESERQRVAAAMQQWERDGEVEP